MQTVVDYQSFISGLPRDVLGPVVQLAMPIGTMALGASCSVALGVAFDAASGL